jgi:hypothetical protein
VATPTTSAGPVSSNGAVPVWVWPVVAGVIGVALLGAWAARRR